MRDSDTVLPLSDVIASLAPSSFAAIITTLRRDLTTHYISRLLTQPASLEVSSTTALSDILEEHTMTVILDPPHSDTLLSRIENVSTALKFLQDHLFPTLPASASFPQSLCKPLSSALLTELLIPSLPSTAADLSGFLEVVDRAIDFEESYLGQMSGNKSAEKEVAAWADAVAAHYERKRRVEILDHARSLIVSGEAEASSCREEIAATASAPEALSAELMRESSPEDTAWGFEGNPDDGVDEDEWGFDAEVSKPEVEAAVASPSPETSTQAGDEEEGVDPVDAWGWNDDDESAPPGPVDEDNSTDSAAWDDPWGDDLSPPAVPAAPKSKPKAARKLEKLSSRGKRKQGAAPESADIQSPIPLAAPPPTPAMPSTTQAQPKSAPMVPRAPETYLVSGRAKEMFALMESVLDEASELSSSDVLAAHVSSASPPIGNVLRETATQVLELYRALYPVSAGAHLADSPKRSWGFSNNCFWLNEQMSEAATRPSISEPTASKLREGGEIFKLLSESWYDDTLVSIAVGFANRALTNRKGRTGTESQRDT